MNIFWCGVNAVALGLSGTNAYLYLQASKRRGLFFYLLFVVCDFYMTKNFSGRFLVGLRWWSVVDEDGKLKWRYETRNVQIINVFHL